MNLTVTRRLGCTLTQGRTSSGTLYASHAHHLENTSCWMEIACFSKFPEVPSLSGTMIQERNDLLASTKGAGEPTCIIRIEFELFDNESPKTCANFRYLCTGQSTSRQGQTYVFKGVTPSYRGTYFHKIIPRFCVQGGDLTMRVNKGGANHFSSFGRGWFNDECKKRRINKIGLLLMANNGPNSNGSQFFITTSETNEKVFQGRYVCFGRIVRGLEEFIKEVAPYGDIDGNPSRFAVIIDCGMGPLPETMETINSLGKTREEDDHRIVINNDITTAADNNYNKEQEEKKKDNHHQGYMNEYVTGEETATICTDTVKQQNLKKGKGGSVSFK